MLKNLAGVEYAITEWTIKESILDDATFSTQKEWNDREEKVHNDVLMVPVIDESGMFSLLNNNCEITEFDDLVESFGFWYERGYSWSLGFYPTGNYDYRRLNGNYIFKLLDPRWLRKAALVKAAAGHQCKDRGERGHLETYHCYYVTMSLDYESWEHPLGASRALCPTCHITRPISEIRARAFLARLNQSQLSRLLDGLDNSFNRFEADSSIGFMWKASFHKTYMDEALLLLKRSTDIYD